MESTINLAFCNDCDFLTWENYTSTHAYLDALNLPCGDSFWLFDPSGSDMGLFTYDTNHPGPRHNEILEEIAAGRIDILHSAGSYGELFNKGYKPERKLVEKALAYLSKHAKIPQIWTNHGDSFNTQNIGGEFPSPHHRGDVRNSDEYMLDLLRDHGVKYFWLDRLLIPGAETPYKILSSEKCRSGHVIQTFSRFWGLNRSPNGENLAAQISLENISKMRSIRQSAIIYQHFGAHHTPLGKAFSAPPGKAFGEQTMRALHDLSEMQSRGEVKVLRLKELLLSEESKTLASESQRIGQYAVLSESGKSDDFYYRQYNVRSVDYFSQRIKQLGLSGEAALDAGCGVGQWSFAMTDYFNNVFAIDYNDEAHAIVKKMSQLLRQNSPFFLKGSIESMPFENEKFDAIVCYGVIFSTDVEVTLREFFRVLRPGGKAYICLNGDGWCDYLIQERFKDSSEEVKISYCLTLWNSLLDRSGGHDSFLRLLRDPQVREIAQKKNPSTAELTDLILSLLPKDYIEIFNRYGNETKRLLGLYVHQYLQLADPARRTPAPLLSTAFSEKISKKIKYAIRNCVGESGILHLLRIKIGARRILRHWHAVYERFHSLLHPSFSTVNGNSVKLISEMDYPDSQLGARPITKYVNLAPGRSNRAFTPKEFQSLTQAAGFESFNWGADGEICGPKMEKLVRPIYEATYNNNISVWECVIQKP